MSFKTALFALALTAFCSLSTNAQTDFFWSPVELNSGAVNDAANVEYRPGDTGTLFLYYTTNGPIDSDINIAAFLDISTTITGVIQFTAAESFNFDIEYNGTPVSTRWHPFGFGPNATVTNDMVDRLFTSIPGAIGTGLLEAHTGPDLIDTGYDRDADAFLWGSVDFLVVGDLGDATDLITERDEIGIVNDGRQIFPTFGNATITVVPEPTSSALVMMGLLGFSAIRRRQ